MKNFNEETQQFIFKKNLPHNFLAEKIVLSCLLINQEAIDITLRIVKIETFYFQNHQQIYQTILIMHKNKIPVDIVTLTSYLQDQGLLEKIGGIKVLNEIVNQIPNLVYLDEYIRLIQDKFFRRCLIKLGYETMNSGFITNIPLEKILNDLEIQFFNLLTETRPPKINNNAQLFTNIFLELKRKSLKPSFSGVTSGYPDLDYLTQGFQKSDLIIVAGRPSMGKTALCLNIAVNVVKKIKLPVLFFSLEMSKEQLIYRLLASETNISNLRLKTGNLSKKDWKNLTTNIKDLAGLPFFIEDTPNLLIQDIYSKIKKILIEQKNIGLIVLDYLQLMQNPKFKIESRVQEISQITRALKNIAREFQVPIIVLSQLSRSVENRINKRPVLSDLRESGSIEQDADLVLMLYRSSYYDSTSLVNIDVNKVKENSIELTEIIIAKQRNGPIGTIKLNFDVEHAKFLNL